MGPKLLSPVKQPVLVTGVSACPQAAAPTPKTSAQDRADASAYLPIIFIVGRLSPAVGLAAVGGRALSAHDASSQLGASKARFRSGRGKRSGQPLSDVVGTSRVCARFYGVRTGVRRATHLEEEPPGPRQ